MKPRNIFCAAVSGFLLCTAFHLASASAQLQLPKELPMELKAGKTMFNRNCADCHGQAGKGAWISGPPLVHKIYGPNHHDHDDEAHHNHDDKAFYRAVQNGVMAHHWNFGNMPPLSHVSRDEVERIIQYIHWLQKQAGIF